MSLDRNRPSQARKLDFSCQQDLELGKAALKCPLTVSKSSRDPNSKLQPTPRRRSGRLLAKKHGDSNQEVEIKRQKEDKNEEEERLTTDDELEDDLLAEAARRVSPNRTAAAKEFDFFDEENFVPSRHFGLLTEKPVDENHFEKLKSLPHIMRDIFSHLPMLDLAQVVNRVCRHWNQVVEEESFLKWKKLYFEYRKNRANKVDKLIASKCRNFHVRSNALMELLKIINASHISIPTPYELDNLIGVLEEQENYSCLDWIINNCWFEHGAQQPTIWTRISVTAFLLSTSSALPLRDYIEQLISTCATQRENVIECLYLLAALLLYCHRKLFISPRFHYNLYSALYFIENSRGKCQQLDSQREKKPLTFEQLRIINYNLKPGECVKIIALAGTGKTTTLIEYVKGRPGWRFLVLMFNKNICQDVRHKFPPNATVLTTHSLAYRHRLANRSDRGLSLGQKYRAKLLLNASLRYNDVENVLNKGLKGISHFQQAKLAIMTVSAFLGSDEEEISVANVPEHDLDEKKKPIPFSIQLELVKVARSIWNCMKDEKNDEVKMTHDGYLKLFQLLKPCIVDENGRQYDAILVDEAQVSLEKVSDLDMNPAMLDIIKRQKYVARILVGDPNQQIYSFRGAVNALDSMNDVISKKFFLTQSFRFGPEIGFIASCWLDKVKKMHTTVLVGSEKEDTVAVTREIKQLCVICRSNVAVFQECVEYASLSPPPALCLLGGIDSFGLDDISDIYLLHLPKEQRQQEFNKGFYAKFETAADLERFAKKRYDNDLEKKISIVTKYMHQIPTHLARIKSCLTSNLERATVIVTTAHKAKGMEFEAVRLADDFSSPDDVADFGFLSSCHDEVSIYRPRLSKLLEDENNLLYVAVTRAKSTLILSGTMYRFLTTHAHDWLESVRSIGEANTLFQRNTAVENFEMRCQKCSINLLEHFAGQRPILIHEPISQRHKFHTKAYLASRYPFCPSCARDSTPLTRHFRVDIRTDLNENEALRRTNDTETNSFKSATFGIKTESELKAMKRMSNEFSMRSVSSEFAMSSDFTREFLASLFPEEKGESQIQHDEVGDGD